MIAQCMSTVKILLCIYKNLQVDERKDEFYYASTMNGLAHYNRQQEIKCTMASIYIYIRVILNFFIELILSLVQYSVICIHFQSDS